MSLEVARRMSISLLAIDGERTLILAVLLNPFLTNFKIQAYRGKPFPRLYLDRYIVHNPIRTASRLGVEYPYIRRYYEKATATISVSDALSCKEGFLYSRLEFKYPFSPCRINMVSLDGNCQPLVISQPRHKYGDIPYSSPLHRRGWILQERIFSHRTIFFGKRCTTWYCCGSDAYGNLARCSPVWAITLTRCTTPI